MVDPIAVALPGVAIAAAVASLLTLGVRSTALSIIAPIVAAPSALPPWDFGHLSFSKIKLEFAGIKAGPSSRCRLYSASSSNGRIIYRHLWSI
jgi:hypothetical protein